jgi:hypothetical protein
MGARRPRTLTAHAQTDEGARGLPQSSDAEAGPPACFTARAEFGLAVSSKPTHAGHETAALAKISVDAAPTTTSHEHARTNGTRLVLTFSELAPFTVSARGSSTSFGRGRPPARGGLKPLTSHSGAPALTACCH